MPDLILDSWAIMAWLKGQEPAATRVRALLASVRRRERRIGMNIMNLGEVFYLSVKVKDMRYGERVLAALRQHISIFSADDDLVMRAAGLKGRYAISYADGFAAATAMQHDLPLVTGDPELRVLSAQETKLKIEWIGPA